MAKTVQVGNMSPMITEPHLREFFGHVGSVVQVKVLPIDLAAGGVRTAFVEFVEEADASLSLYLTNTIFIDRPFIISAAPDGIPANAETLVQAPVNPHSLLPSPMHPPMQGAAPPQGPGSLLVPVVPGTVAVLGPNGMQRAPQFMPPAQTMMNLPPLGTNVDPSKIDEIRRTVYVGNLPSSVSPDQLVQFFSSAGPILFCRLAGEETQSTRFAFVEFDSIQTALTAISMNGMLLEGRPVKVNHSKNPIVKATPRIPTAQEIEETMRRVREAGQKIASKANEDAPAAQGDGASGANPAHPQQAQPTGERKDSAVSRPRSPSPARDRRRSRSRSRSPRSRRHKSRSRSRSRERRRRERSIERRRERDSRDTRDTRDTRDSRDRRDRDRDRERERERDRERGSSSRDKERESRDKDKDRDRKDRGRSDRDRERDRDRRDKKDRRERSGEREKKKDDAEEEVRADGDVPMDAAPGHSEAKGDANIIGDASEPKAAGEGPEPMEM